MDHPLLRVVTLAPEYPTALTLITRLMQRGVKVQFGHTNATYDEARAGYEFGASGATHFFNAMRPFHHREAGVVGYGLANEDLFTELIYDRHHVCKESAAHVIKSKPKTRVIAVSDATCAAGLPKGSEVDMWGHHATVGPNDVRLDDGTLAGSVTTLDVAFKYLAEDLGIETAIRTCCMNPRFYLGLTKSPKLWLEFDKHLELIEMHRVG
jgi:N-acetylglucosamine-6-phosphate deacetylase